MARVNSALCRRAKHVWCHTVVTTMKDDARTNLQVLKQVLTFKRVLLLVVLGVLFGLLPLQFWPAAFLQSAFV
jgi:hypothetical protein